MKTYVSARSASQAKEAIKLISTNAPSALCAAESPVHISIYGVALWKSYYIGACIRLSVRAGPELESLSL
jgi:hypothetical protein